MGTGLKAVVVYTNLVLNPLFPQAESSETRSVWHHRYTTQLTSQLTNRTLQARVVYVGLTRLATWNLNGPFMRVDAFKNKRTRIFLHNVIQSFTYKVELNNISEQATVNPMQYDLAKIKYSKP